MANFCILIADDDDDDYFILMQAFNEVTAHDIVRVSDGQQLLEYLDLKSIALQKFPDLILLDINMPKMDGIKALEMIKSSAALCQIPVLMYSTSNDQKQIEKCKVLGANDFISKHCHNNEIVAFVRDIDNYLKELQSDPLKPFVHKIKPGTLSK